MKMIVQSGHIYDPAEKRNGIYDILIDNGVITKIGKSLKADGARVINAEKKIVMPGLIDMHAHLREPGREDAETIDTGLAAAARGGFAAVCAMPNTDPCCDNQEVVEFISEKARRAKKARLYPIGAITKGREGKELAEIAELKRAGCVALSDDGTCVGGAGILRRGCEYAAAHGLTIIEHCEDLSLSGDGVMHEGYIATILGLKGIPSVSESAMVARDIEIAAYTGAAIHIAHVSSKESLDLIRAAKKRGLAVTCETCPHYLIFTEDDLAEYNTHFKMKPPLRTAEDRTALRKAVRDGVIDVIATDHAPHVESEKDLEFDYAPFGIIGFESALGALLTHCVHPGEFGWEDIARTMANNPAAILKLDGGRLVEGGTASVTVIDPEKEWVFTKEDLLSRSANSPFLGKTFRGKPVYTLSRGRIIYQDA